MDVMNEGIDLGGMSIAIAPSGMYIYTCVKCICCIQLLPHDVLLFPPIRRYNRRTLYLRL